MHTKQITNIESQGGQLCLLQFIVVCQAGYQGDKVSVLVPVFVGSLGPQFPTYLKQNHLELIKSLMACVRYMVHCEKG